MPPPVILQAPGGGSGRVPFSFIVEAPVAGDDDDLFIPVPFEATMVEVYHEVAASTSVIINLVWRAAATPVSGGTSLWSSDKTANTTNSKETSFDNAGSGGNDKVLGLHIGTVTGTPQWLRVFGYYTFDN